MRFREMRETEVVNVETKVDVGEELAVVWCSCGCVVKIDETTGQVYGNKCGLERMVQSRLRLVELKMEVLMWSRFGRRMVLVK